MWDQRPAHFLEPAPGSATRFRCQVVGPIQFGHRFQQAAYDFAQPFRWDGAALGQFSRQGPHQQPGRNAGTLGFLVRHA